MNEVKIGDVMYQVGRMPPLKSFHVARKLAPLAFAFGAGLMSNEKVVEAMASEPEVDASGTKVDAVDKISPGDLLTSFEPVTTVLAQMKEEDLDYVFKTCLGYAKRQQASGGWAPVTAGNGQMMFDDIDMNQMIQLTMAVVKENNLANFITAQL